MARGKKSEKNNEHHANTMAEPNSRLLILPDAFVNDQESDSQFVKLRHPRIGDLAIYLYSENDKKLAQMRSLPFPHRSVFNGNYVIPVAEASFVTMVDPLFIFLPYFIKCSSMFSPLDQILSDEELPELNNQLMKLSSWTDVQRVATKKETGDLVLWQYSESKTLEWLTPKVKKISDVLVSQQINVNPNIAISSTFKLSDANLQSSEDQYKRYSYSIISEYLPIDVQKPFLKHLGLPEKVENNKRKSDVNGTNLNKKVKHNEVQYDEMPYKVEKIVPSKLTAKDKALKKAASGTKSISSFFKKV